MGSCSSAEDLISRYPYISQLTNTDCLNSRAVNIEDDNEDFTTFGMNITGNSADCFFKSLEYPCDFGKVNVEVHNDDITIIIIEYPSSDLADCICEINATFKIEELPDDSFVLKIYHGNTKGEYRLSQTN